MLAEQLLTNLQLLPTSKFLASKLPVTARLPCCKLDILVLQIHVAFIVYVLFDDSLALICIIYNGTMILYTVLLFKWFICV